MAPVKLASFETQEEATTATAMSNASRSLTVIVETCLAAALTSALKIARGVCSLPSAAQRKMSLFCSAKLVYQKGMAHSLASRELS